MFICTNVIIRKSLLIDVLSLDLQNCTDGGDNRLQGKKHLPRNTRWLSPTLPSPENYSAPQYYFTHSSVIITTTLSYYNNDHESDKYDELIFVLFVVKENVLLVIDLWERFCFWHSRPWLLPSAAAADG